MGLVIRRGRKIQCLLMEDMISVRVPKELRSALERERLRMTKAAGAEVKASAVIRSILEQRLLARPKRAAKRAA